MNILAWLLTYFIHSTALLGIAWLVTRARRVDPGAKDLLWKVALLAPLVTGTIQSRLALATPAAVRLPVATVPQTSRSSQSAAPIAPIEQPSQTPTRTPKPESRTPSPALLIVLLWGVIALASSLYYVARRLILIGRLADRRAVSEGPLVATLAELRDTTGFRRRVRLTMARTISSPVALGLSEICVPELALSELGTDQQRSMLAHELAHLARHDSVWLSGASLMERVFFFQPLNRLARRELETSAEYLSDEWAMKKTGSGGAVSLAKCLATVAEWIQASPLGVPVAGLAERRSLLVSRIARLLESRSAQHPAARIGWAALATLGVVVTIAAAPRVSSPSATLLSSSPDPLSAMRRGGTSGESIDTTLDARVPPLRQERGPRGGEDGRAMRGSGGTDGRMQESVATTQDTGVVNALIARLKDENAGVRRAAASSLGRLGDPRAVMPLIAVLADSDADVRSEALEALSNFEDPRAINPIAAMLKDPVTDVRHNALNALSHWDHGVPTAPVIALLDDSDADVRHEAVNVLDNMHVRSAAPAIARLVHDPNPDVREQAIGTLGDLGDQSSAAAITEALTDANPDVRGRALGALDDLKAPIAEATLLKLLTDLDADVRERAARLAGDRSIIPAIPALRRLIDDPKGDVREAATQALGQIADPAARAALQAALQSPDPNVRRKAAEALGQDP